MKTSSNLAIIFAAIVSAFALAKVGSVEVAQPAQQQAILPAEQYRVIDMSQLPVKGTPAATLEAVLNDLGAQGWSVRTSVGTAIILSR